jgi:cobalamin biosynthesis protein CobD/CbiB
MTSSFEFSSIATTIQSAVAPVFLFAGIGGILNVVGMRLSRSIDRTRVLEELHAKSNGVEHHRYAAELAMLERRIKHSNRATTLCVGSALAVCLVVVLLFVSQIIRFNLGTIIALIFVVAMILLAGGLIEFLTEIHIAVGGRRVHREHLNRPGV